MGGEGQVDLVWVRQSPGKGWAERREVVVGVGDGVVGLPGQTAELLQGLCSRSGPLHWVL